MLPPVAMDDDIAQASEDYIKAIHSGKLHSKQIHHGLYDTTAKKLIGGIMQSYKSGYGYDSPVNSALMHMQSNIYAFSAAKNFTMFREFSKHLVKDGKRIPGFGEFKKSIEKLNVNFNERYLLAEYNSAVAIGQMSEKWHEFEDNKEAGEYLEYRTAGDERVRASHKALDNKVFHIDDDILKRIYPPNDWGCRCTMVQVDDPARRTDPGQHDWLEKQASIPKYFRNNTGKSGMVYDHEHPYFKNLTTGQLKQLKAVDHYNMKSVRKIYDQPDKLHTAPKPLSSLEEFENWYSNKIKKANTGNNDFYFTLDSLQGVNVVFDQDLYKRITKGRKYLAEKRYQFAPHLEQTMLDPDEVWTLYDTKRHGSKADLITIFLRYYKDKPFVVVSKSLMGSQVRITSIYKTSTIERSAQFRNGILMFRK